MPLPIHLKIEYKIPPWRKAKTKQYGKEIRKTLQENEYDDDVIENINDDFCEGWDAARDVILKLLSDSYWTEKRTSCDFLTQPKETAQPATKSGVTLADFTTKKLTRWVQTETDRTRLFIEITLDCEAETLYIRGHRKKVQDGKVIEDKIRISKNLYHISAFRNRELDCLNRIKKEITQTNNKDIFAIAEEILDA